MTDDLDQLRERTRQNRESLTDEIGRTESPTSLAPGGTAAPFVVGTRVLDRVTGQEGVVETLGGIPGVKRPLIAVRLPGGGILLRPLEELARL